MLDELVAVIDGVSGILCRAGTKDTLAYELQDHTVRYGREEVVNNTFHLRLNCRAL
jgi:hypothetical protein